MSLWVLEFYWFKLLCTSGLNNDSSPETFILRHTLGDLPFPCRYIKIVPLQSWGSSYNFSIWFVELKGSDSLDEVKKAVQWFDKVRCSYCFLSLFWREDQFNSIRYIFQYREKEVVRLCLKHFRLLNYQNVFSELAESSNVMLEDTLLSELFNLLVLKGDFDGSESFMEKAISS